MITSEVLGGDGGTRHAFFTREGGVSEGLFGSLNCGFGSGDESQRVAANREIAMAQLGLPADRLVTAKSTAPRSLSSSGRGAAKRHLRRMVS